MVMPRVLVACEYSGTVREAFRARGFDAWSCDLLPADDDSPHHIQGDALDLLGDGWDLLIAHPPCQYMSRAGARWLYEGGELNQQRYAKGLEAREFFMRFLEAPVPRVAVENPTPMRVFDLPPWSHTIDPSEFGHGYTKLTRLWLKGLPPLMPTCHVANAVSFLPSNVGLKARLGGKSSPGVVKGGLEAARTFTGVAEAMADQWGAFLW